MVPVHSVPLLLGRASQAEKELVDEQCVLVGQEIAGYAEHYDSLAISLCMPHRPQASTPVGHRRYWPSEGFTTKWYAATRQQKKPPIHTGGSLTGKR